MKIFAFDLDGTLAKSKSPIDEQMKNLLVDLLEQTQVCVVSGGKMEQFRDQLIKPLTPFCSNTFYNLHLFPTCGTTYYTVNANGDLMQVYKNDLDLSELTKITLAFDIMFKETGYNESKVYGEVIERRGSQVTFSALGQEAPYDLKKAWDPTRTRRQKMIEVLQPLLLDFDVRLGGTTSVDVTRKGMNKSFAIKMIKKYLHCKEDKLIFFGDALDPGGNDHAVYQAGVLSIPVQDHIDCIWKVKLYLN